MYGYIEIIKEIESPDCNEFLFSIKNSIILTHFSLYLSDENMLEMANGLKNFSGKHDDSYCFSIGDTENIEYYCYFKLSAIYFKDNNTTSLHLDYKTNLSPPYNHSVNFYLIAEVAEINRLGSMLEQWIQDKDADYLVWSKDEYFIGDRYAHQDFWQ